MSLRSAPLPDQSARSKARAVNPPPLDLGQRALVVTLIVGAWAGASLMSLAGRR